MIEIVELDCGNRVLLGFDDEKNVCVGVGEANVDMTGYEVINKIYKHMEAKGLASMMYFYGENLQEHFISRRGQSPFYLDKHGFIRYK